MTARRRRILRWTAGAALAFAGLWAAYRSAARLAEEGPQVAANRLLLTALTLAIVLLGLGFVGVLIRNVALLILERRRGVLGSSASIGTGGFLASTARLSCDNATTGTLSSLARAFSEREISEIYC